jgi:hypothetical protein
MLAENPTSLDHCLNGLVQRKIVEERPGLDGAVSMDCVD